MARIRRVGDVQVVEAMGDIAIGRSELGQPLDLHGRRIEDIGETLGRLMTVDCPRIVVDLRRVNFIDSAGIGQLVRWMKRARQQQGDIKLIVGDGRVQRMLTMLDLQRVFGIYADESAAVNSF